MKKYCYICNSNRDVESIIINNTYHFRGENLKIVEECFKCKKCGEILGSDTLDDNLYKIYNSYLMLYNLSFAKIKQIRKNYNLSIELFSKVLSWSKKTIVRYENADSVPQGEYLSTYEKLNNEPEYIYEVLKRNKNNISCEDYNKIIKTIKTKISFKSINVILYLLKDNPLYTTQLMKNLFAIDFQNYKETKTSITNFKYIHMPYGPAIDKRDNLLTILIKNNFIRSESHEDKIKYLSNLEFDKSLFTTNELNVMKRVKEKLSLYTSSELSAKSHKFKGWKETKDGKEIKYSFAEYFDLDKIFN